MTMTVEVPADAEPHSFAEAYRRRLADGWEADAAQQSAVSQLSHLLAALRRDGGKPPTGLYLHGPVGRGKSQLLSLFMPYVPGDARRTHMHAFMGEVHARLHGLKGSDPIALLSREMAGEFRLLGFDEFYITNIADAMLLGRLFEHLFKEGVVIVATSNWPMEDLYLNGRNRKAFLPFLRLLKQHLNPVDLGDGRDYRRGEEEAWPLYVLDSDAASAAARLAELFERYGGAGHDETQPHLPAGLTAKAWRERAGWFEFGELCRWGLGRQEYLGLVEHASTLVVEGVPVFAEGEADAVLRFVTLIDICYEHHCRVVISAPDYPEALYADGPVVTAYRRAASRLAEMQSW
jgi:cell division protein ZapE